MSVETNYDATILDLNQCLMENKTRHRSPIIHLPELFMYKYSYQDVLECANNFKSCVFDKSDDPVVNTVNYYSHKYEKSIPSDKLNVILDIIYENAYSIFHIDKDGTTYLASLSNKNPTICIESVCINWNQIPDEQCDVRILWNTKNKTVSFDEFSKIMYDKVHNENYKMNRNLLKILNIDQDINDNFNTMPYFTYASEDSSDAEDTFMAELDSIQFDFADESVEDDLEYTPAFEAPDDAGGDGLSDLENMTNPNNNKQSKPKRGRKQRNVDPVNELEEISGNTPDNEKAPETNDDTPEGNAVDIAQMTNDQMQEGGDQDTEQLSNDEDPEGGGAIDEGDVPTDDEEDPGLDDNPDDTSEDDETGEEDDTEILNNPESKEVYRKRFIALYKHINDVIDTLERFTPAYNVKCTNEYYTIQNNMHRLKTAIYKICTEKIKDMQTVDVMNAYLTSNYAYDSMGQMLKEFFKRYQIERGNLKNSKSNHKE